MRKARLAELVRSFLFYLDLLRLDTEVDITSNWFENIRNNYFRTNQTAAPDNLSSYLKTSLQKLYNKGLIDLERNLSDFNVKLEEVPFDVALERLLDQHPSTDAFFSLGEKSNLEEGLETTIDELYKKDTYYVGNILRAFYDERFHVEYIPREGKLIIKVR